MAQKPPAFQFYAKDWRSSPTVARMSRQQKGDYIELLAACWDSDEPGTLPLPIELAARLARLHPRSLLDLRSKYPSIFIEVQGRLVNEKLRNQWLKYKEISEKRAKAAHSMHQSQTHASAQQMLYSASASASAPAITTKAPPTPRAAQSALRGQFVAHELRVAGGVVIVMAPKHKKRFMTKTQAEAMVGSRPEEIAEWFRNRGFDAKVKA